MAEDEDTRSNQARVEQSIAEKQAKRPGVDHNGRPIMDEAQHQAREHARTEATKAFIRRHIAPATGTTP
jgi:hypothetical protein